jgi:hypothetical protein
MLSICIFGYAIKREDTDEGCRSFPFNVNAISCDWEKKEKRKQKKRKSRADVS